MLHPSKLTIPTNCTTGRTNPFHISTNDPYGVLHYQQLLQHLPMWEPGGKAPIPPWTLDLHRNPCPKSVPSITPPNSQLSTEALMALLLRHSLAAVQSAERHVPPTSTVLNPQTLILNPEFHYLLSPVSRGPSTEQQKQSNESANEAHGRMSENDGCIDLSISGQRKSISSGDHPFSVNELAHSSLIESPAKRFPVLSNSSTQQFVDHSQSSTSGFISPIHPGALPMIKSEPESRMHNTRPPSVQPRTKNRRSGFQAGVTVGYTYDAFFISDGRSRRRRTVKNRRTDKHHLAAMSASMANSSGTSSSTTSSSFGSEGPTEQSMSHANLIANTLSPMATEQTGHRYICPECGKSYATSSNLSRHKQTHRSLDSQAARRCPHCGKAYVSMPALSMHILTHDLKHRCDLCGKAFSRPWLLQGHRRAHTGEKPYGCAHCGRAFADRSNLRAHMQTHSGMKQYECGKCRKNFALKSYLNKHLEAGCLGQLEPENNMPQTNTSSNLAWSVTRLIAEEA